MRYKVKKQIADIQAGTIIDYDEHWHEWIVGNKTLNTRGSIEEGETVLLLNYAREANLRTFLEPVESDVAHA